MMPAERRAGPPPVPSGLSLMTPRVLLLVVLLCAACRPPEPPATYLLDEAALPDYERTLDREQRPYFAPVSHEWAR